MWTGQHELHLDLGDRRLEFHGIRRARIPPVPAAWLYDEMHLAPDNGFELRALFDCGEDCAGPQEFRVVATEVRVFNCRLKRYVIPDEPPPDPPTLFLDRKQRHSRKR